VEIALDALLTIGRLGDGRLVDIGTVAAAIAGE
jgi:hypothetical protein